MTCSTVGHASSTMARVRRGARRERARDRVANVAGAGLHPLRHRRLVAVPMAVEGLVADARGLVEHAQRDDAGGALAVGPIVRRRVLVVAVVAVQRLGHEVSGPPDADRRRALPRTALACRGRRPRSTPARGRAARRPVSRPSTSPSRLPRRRCPSAARAVTREQLRRDLVDELGAHVASRARRTIPDEVDQLLHREEPSVAGLAV